MNNYKIPAGRHSWPGFFISSICIKSDAPTERLTAIETLKKLTEQKIARREKSRQAIKNKQNNRLKFIQFADRHYKKYRLYLKHKQTGGTKNENL